MALGMRVVRNGLQSSTKLPFSWQASQIAMTSQNSCQNLDNMMETLGGLQYLNMNEHLQLSDLMSASDYQRVKTYFDQHKTMLPFSMMQHLKPYFITALISRFNNSMIASGVCAGATMPSSVSAS